MFDPDTPDALEQLLFGAPDPEAFATPAGRAATMLNVRIGALTGAVAALADHPDYVAAAIEARRISSLACEDATADPVMDRICNRPLGELLDACQAIVDDARARCETSRALEDLFGVTDAGDTVVVVFDLKMLSALAAEALVRFEDDMAWEFSAGVAAAEMPRAIAEGLADLGGVTVVGPPVVIDGDAIGFVPRVAYVAAQGVAADEIAVAAMSYGVRCADELGRLDRQS